MTHVTRSRNRRHKSTALFYGAGFWYVCHANVPAYIHVHHVPAKTGRKTRQKMESIYGAAKTLYIECKVFLCGF